MSETSIESRKSKIKPIEVRFWTKVNKEGPTPQHCPELGPCWVWVGAKINSGYGVIAKWQSDGKMRNAFAHRVSFEMNSGETLPNGVQVLHRCDNPSCVNPAHLFQGSQSDNLRDARAKGRLNCGDRHHSKISPELVLRGESVGTSKLTSDQVLEIKRRGCGYRCFRKLGREFGVGHSTIARIVHGVIWKHIRIQLL